MTTMLKLPQPDGYAALTPRGTIVVPPQDFAKHNAYAIYTADQLRTYAAEVWRCAMEAAAQICERRITNEPGLQREDYENRQCAAALRSLPVPQQEDAALHPQPQKEQQKEQHRD